MNHGSRAALVLLLLTGSSGIRARADAPPPPLLEAPPPPSAAARLGTIRLEEETRRQTFGSTEVPVDHLRPRRRGGGLPGVLVEEGLILQPEVGPDSIRPGVEVKGMLRLDLER